MMASGNKFYSYELRIYFSVCMCVCVCVCVYEHTQISSVTLLGATAFYY